ncbi:MAG TPA: glycosyltransferase family 9 protein [Gammaproteobacteria bacterium]
MDETTLIIKVGALGDVVLCTPQIERIVEHHAASHAGEIWLLTSPPFAPLFAGHPRLRVIAFPRQGARAMLDALRWVRARRFSTVYDLQGSDRTRILTLLSGAGKRVGIAPRWIYTHSPSGDDIREHVFPRLNRLIESAGLPAAEPRPRLWPSSGEQQTVAERLAKEGLNARAFALLHAGSSARWPSKRWETDHFAALARAIEAAGIAVLWIGGPDEAELNRKLAAQAGRDMSGAFSIPGLSELARHARFAVVNDSGPMHLLSAAGIPVYAFFGPTDWQRHHAIGQGGRVFAHPVECSPCYLGTCPPVRRHACLAEIAPADVLDRLRADGVLQP